MTLSQTYISRKQLLVDNLVAKGVTGYTANDGLTTLINAVLEIQGGGVRTLTLTSDKDILSYADSESATLTATLLEDGVAVSGATVEFFNGSTSMGTAQTDSNGVATKTYTSTGAGDVSLKAEADNGMLVSKIYEVHDNIFSWDCTSSSTHTTSELNQVTYSANGMYLKSSVWGNFIVNVPFPKGSVVEFTAKSINSSSNYNYLNLKEENASTNLFGGSFTNSVINIDKPTPTVSKSISGDKLIRIEITSNGEVSLYCNDTLVGTKTISTSSNLIFYWGSGTSNYCTIKDVSIKPL